jgi:pimeloyl-ACP methyl ester carboxylesterase
MSLARVFTVLCIFYNIAMATQFPTTHFLPLPESNTTVFYRTAGNPANPTILLLHGFPSSSHQYRNLIPLLSHKYHVLAPDFPGFGFTTVPSTYTYTFANLTKTTSEFLDALNIKSFIVYIFDYGAPVGLRLALQRPNAVKALISQNGNAYIEGLGAFWDSFEQYWKTGSNADRQALRVDLTLATTKFQYVHGEPHPEAIDPVTWTLDYALISQDPEVQLDLFYDYRTNVELYPEFQAWLRKSQVPTLASWGKNDVIFVKAGAEAFKRDLPHAEVRLLDAGHFAVETHTVEIARLILEFLENKGF